MNWNRVCPGCMREYNANMELPKYCPECGCEYMAENGVYALPPRTILNGKYILGKTIKQEEEEIVYLAYDLNLEVKIQIREFFPQSLAKRGEDKRTVEVLNETLKEQLEKARAGYLENARKMAKAITMSGLDNRIREVFKENSTVYEVLTAGWAEEDEIADSQEYTADLQGSVPAMSVKEDANYTQMPGNYDRTDCDRFMENCETPIPGTAPKKKTGKLPLIIAASILGLALISFIVIGLNNRKPESTWAETDSRGRGSGETEGTVRDYTFNSFSNVLGSLYGNNTLLMAGNFDSLYFGEVQEDGLVPEIYLLDSFEMETEDNVITGVATDDTYIYFSVSGMGIYRVSTEDSNAVYEQITDYGETEQFVLYGDYVYYCMDDVLYQLKKDGAAKTVLVEDASEFYTIADGILYFGRYTDEALYAVNLSTGKEEKLYTFEEIGFPMYDESVKAAFMSPHYLYCIKNNTAYLVKLSSGELVNTGGITEIGNTCGVFIEDDDKIYYVKGEEEKWLFAYDPYDGIAGTNSRIASFDSGIFGIVACCGNYLVVVDNNLDYYTVNKTTGAVQSVSYNYFANN